MDTNRINEFAKLIADGEMLSGITSPADRNILKKFCKGYEELQYERDQLKLATLVLTEVIETADRRLRQMRTDGEITMREMIVALKPLMWIMESYRDHNTLKLLEGTVKHWTNGLVTIDTKKWVGAFNGFLVYRENLETSKGD